MSRGIELKLSTKTRAVPLAMALAGSLALAACGASNETSSGSSSGGSRGAQLSRGLNGAGSSAQQAAMQGWSAGFNKEQPNVTVNYDPLGSGGGRTQFIAGGVDFAGSDAALKTDSELPDAQKRCGGGNFQLPDNTSGPPGAPH